MAQAATMGTVAKAVMAPVATALSRQHNLWTQEAIDGEQAWVRRDPETEQVIDLVKESDPEYGRRARRIARGAQVSGLATGVAAGEGIVGTLGSTMARVAGPVGIAIGGAQAIDSFLVGQGQKATPYRSAFGEEGTGMFAARERFDEGMAALGGFGTIGGERARAQFREASAMGLRGERREDATEFATEMYQRFGMETSAAMGLVEQAVINGSGSLSDFSEAIENVSRAAVEAGRSSAEAVEDFTKAQSFIARNVTGGEASVKVTEQISAAIGDMPTALVKSLGGAEGVSKWMTQGNIQTVAMLSGQDPMSALWQMSNPATAQGAAGQFLGNIGEQIVRLMAQQMGVSTEDLKSRVNELTGGKAVGSDEQHAIFEELAGGTEQAAGLAQQVLQLVIGLFGIPIDYTQMLNFFFEAATGGLAPDPVAGVDKGNSPLSRGMSVVRGGRGGRKGGGSSSPYERVTKPKDASPLGSRTAGPGSRAGMEMSPSLDSAYEKQRFEILENLGYAGTTEWAGAERKYMQVPSDLSKEVNAYVDYVAKTGKSNPQIEALLKGGNRKELLSEAGVSDLSDATFRIDGKDKTLSEILKSGSATEMAKLDAGQASVINAETGDPTSVGEITNVRVQVEFTDEGRTIFRAATGPSESQRNGEPAPSERVPSSYNTYGGR